MSSRFAVRIRRYLVAAVAGVVAAIAGLVLTPQAALATLPGMLYVSASTGSDSAVYKSVTVLCPVGTVVTGGGYELHGGEGAVVLDDFIPFDHTTGDLRSGLLVGAGEVVGPGEPSDGTTASWFITATAYCASRPAGYGIWARTSPNQPGNTQTVVSSCPSGQKVFGNGAALANGWGQISIASLEAVSGATTVAVAVDDEDGYSGNWSITAYAVCANAVTGMSWNVASTNIDSLAGKSDFVACGVSGNNRTVGVGWAVRDWNGGAEQVVNVSANLMNGTGFSVASSGHEDANGYSGNWQVETQAICVF